ncbi:MAG: hypothetical protein QOF26_2618, partial [Baekduia sp.]|nr:hypothetical protein [Baekduia sp.]
MSADPVQDPPAGAGDADGHL